MFFAFAAVGGGARDRVVGSEDFEGEGVACRAGEGREGGVSWGLGEKGGGEEWEERQVGEGEEGGDSGELEGEKV